jgi:structural maintenance of chromosome 1
MTFIPLDKIKVKALDESLRSLGGSTKLVFDIIEFPAEVRLAILYAVGSAVLINTLDEARKISSQSKVRAKSSTEFLSF